VSSGDDVGFCVPELMRGRGQAGLVGPAFPVQLPMPCERAPGSRTGLLPGRRWRRRQASLMRVAASR